MPIHVARDADAEITNHLKMHKIKDRGDNRTKTRSHRKKTRFDILSILLGKITTKIIRRKSPK